MIAGPGPLTLPELEAFDAGTGSDRTERRFLCPFPACCDKTKKNRHRSLTLNTTNRFWHCWRCGAKGRLPDPDEKRQKEDRRHERRERMRQESRRAFTLPDPAPPVSTAWHQWLPGLEPLAETPGADYLRGRQVPPEVAQACAARYHGDWMGRPAVVFPLRDRAGNLVGAQGRYTDGREDPKTRTVGTAAAGVYATIGAWEADPLILVEAPICALSLAWLGYPTLATCGCQLSDWVAWSCAFRNVVVATDNDEPGNAAAAVWVPLLRSRGATVRRMRPAGGGDWNQALVQDQEALCRALAAAL